MLLEITIFIDEYNDDILEDLVTEYHKKQIWITFEIEEYIQLYILKDEKYFYIEDINDHKKINVFVNKTVKSIDIQQQWLTSLLNFK